MIIFPQEWKATFSVALKNPAQEVPIEVSVPLFIPEKVPLEVKVEITVEVWPRPLPPLALAAKIPPLSSQ